MSITQIAIAVMLTLGVLVFWLCSLGLLLMRTPFDRLHYLGPATVLGVPLLVGALLVEKHLTGDGIKAILIGLTVIVTGPVLSHATARAARVRQTGDLQADPSDQVDSR